jgi:hypothetical protein
VALVESVCGEESQPHGRLVRWGPGLLEVAPARHATNRPQIVIAELRAKSRRLHVPAEARGGHEVVDLLGVLRITHDKRAHGARACGTQVPEPPGPPGPDGILPETIKAIANGMRLILPVAKYSWLRMTWISHNEQLANAAAGMIKDYQGLSSFLSKEAAYFLVSCGRALLEANRTLAGHTSALRASSPSW